VAAQDSTRDNLLLDPKPSLLPLCCHYCLLY